MQRAILILACFLFCANCFAQQYPFVHYTPKDGLVNSRVRKAYQDSKGRMYFLTFGGLSIYDGARFKNYTTRDGLSSSLVNDIMEVGDDSLLVATNSGEYLNVLMHGKVSNLNAEPNSPVINQFYYHDNKKIYLPSDDGLYVLENKKIHRLNVLKNNQPAVISNLRSITGIGNWLLLSTSEMSDWHGVYLYDIKNNNICDSLDCFLIDKDKSNNIWIFSSNQLSVVDQSLFEKRKLSAIPPSGPYQQSNGYLTTNIAFDEHSAWFVYRNPENRNVEIRRIDQNGALFRMPLPAKTTPSVITNIFVDKEGIVWLCNDGEGVFKIVNSSLSIFEDILGKPMNGSIENVFYSNGETWYSTNTNKLFRKSDKEIYEFTPDIKTAIRVFFYNEQKLYAHDYNKIYEGKLNEINRTIRFNIVATLPDADFFGKRLIVDKNENILTIQKSGLSVRKNNTIIQYIPNPAFPDIIDELCYDKNYLLWSLHRYTGINVYSTHPEDPSNYLRLDHHFDPKQINGSPRCLVIDKTGLIWIGTRENGVTVYRHEGDQLNKLYQFDAGNGLTDNFVMSLACDSSNNIIVGTQTGLDRILRSQENEYRIENLTKNNNFFSLIYQVWADEKYAYARCYSGTILQVSPPGQKVTNQKPDLLLEEIRVNAQTLSGQKNSFRHNENTISFLVAAPSFIDEKQISYSYLLKGTGNDNWSDTSSVNTVINLINLSPGNYSLNVKAFFPSGLYAPAELSFPFVITPPWWQSWWFRVGIVLLGIWILVIAFRFYFRRKLEKQKVMLEKQQAIEKERTRIATDMHDDLGAGLSRIKFLSETIGIKKQTQQPIEEDISKIRDYSHEMIDKMGEIVWALNEKNDSLSDLLSYSRSYAVEYLSQNGIACVVEAPDNFPAVFVSGEFRRNIYLTLKEALHNIVKHALANQVNITIKIKDDLEITIQDDGIGFDKNNIRPFSNGLLNMEKRMKDIGGNIRIKNKKGTTVEVVAPLS